MSKILIGPAGSGGAALEGFEKIKTLGLDAVEVEFTYGVWMKNPDAENIGELNKKLNLKISIHCPYFINLCSKEKPKLEASKKRILQSCERGHLMGAKYIVFHPAYYGKLTKEQAYETVKQQIQELQKTIKSNKWDVILAPETTGKSSQFGSLDELLKLKKETNCHLCIDFAHLKAREQGKISYKEIIEKIPKSIGYIHAHFSGIEWAQKGEKRHILTPDSEIKELLKAIKKSNIPATIINESPDPIGDAIKTKKILAKL